MGEMAQDALYRAELEELELSEYLGGYLSDDDAYDLGLIDEYGSVGREGTLYAESQEIPTLEYCNHELKVMGLQLDAVSSLRKVSYREGLKKAFPNLSIIAIFNLFKDSPTCNSCNTQMSERVGRFGKFYFCEKGCTSQRAVSDSYWKSLKQRLERV